MTDVVVIGGGIAGLTAAALLGKSGRSVTLIEQAEHFGGRARTQTTPDGFHFNIGPHALYRNGHAIRVLRELGITIDENKVGDSGANVIKDGRVQVFPIGAMSLFATTLFSLSGKLEAARLLAQLPRIKTEPLSAVTVRDWLDTTIRNGGVREMFEALLRVSTYSNAPDEASAGAALQQLRTAVSGGVSYLNGGWQTMVDRVRRAAESSGVTMRTDSSARAVEYESDEARGVRLSDGGLIPADSVVLAVSPKDVLKLIGHGAGSRFEQWIESAIPVQAACLDLGLRRLMQPQRTFALGFDVPIYLSVHSRWAELGPKGAALVHVAKYLGPKETDPSADRRKLEEFTELVQPGWRPEVIHARFLPRMTVSHALVRAKDGGFAGRPAVDAPQVRNVYLAGDWVGAEGMLADASLASAHRAAALILGKLQSMLHAQAV